MSKITYEIEPANDSVGFWIVQCSIFGPSSVLAGQDSRQKWMFFDTVAEAQAWAAEEGITISDVLEEPPLRMDFGMSYEPESWFDPADAGETWGENDY